MTGDCPRLAEAARFRFMADPGEVRAALRRAVARFARRMTPDDAGTLEVALAEVLNNVVEHAHAGLPPGMVGLTLRWEPAALWCQVDDGGHPMPDATLPAGQLPLEGAEFESLPEGGWGWALIRAMTTDLGYERADGRNRLTFRIPLSEPGQRPARAEGSGLAVG